jgi:hypothetical protein
MLASLNPSKHALDASSKSLETASPAYQLLPTPRHATKKFDQYRELLGHKSPFYLLLRYLWGPDQARGVGQGLRRVEEPLPPGVGVVAEHIAPSPELALKKQSGLASTSKYFLCDTKHLKSPPL